MSGWLSVSVRQGESRVVFCHIRWKMSVWHPSPQTHQFTLETHSTKESVPWFLMSAEASAASPSRWSPWAGHHTPLSSHNQPLPSAVKTQTIQNTWTVYQLPCVQRSNWDTLNILHKSKNNVLIWGLLTMYLCPSWTLSWKFCWCLLICMHPHLPSFNSCYK